MFEERSRLERTTAHGVALDCVAAGIEAAHPGTVVQNAIRVENGTMLIQGDPVDLNAVDEVLVVGGGKAAGTAASAIEEVLGERIDRGLAVTDNPAPTETIRVLDGDHPVPSERGVENTRRLLDVVDSAGEGDLVVVLVTGGGSALLTAPAAGLSLGDVQAVTDGLLRSGATIGEINAVRKHLSRIKGGKLAQAAAPARVVGLVFSDVVGDDLGTIASGPTAPDGTTYADALAVLDRYDLSVPVAVRDHLECGADGEEPETASDVALGHVENYVLANGRTALDAAARVAETRGYQSLVLSSRIRGEAREAARSHVAIAEECVHAGSPADPPVVLLSGGETTVTEPGDGSGGPNQEFALSAALELGNAGGVLASVDTDGVDGPTDAAGALVDDRTVSDRDAAVRALDGHDSYRFLDEQGALVRTGPTGTNVNDLRVHVLPGD